MGPPAREAAPKLIEALNDECGWVRSDAAESIGQMGSFAPEGAVAAAVHRLLEMVNATDSLERSAVVGALARLAPCVPNGVEVPARALGDAYDCVCTSALESGRRWSIGNP